MAMTRLFRSPRERPPNAVFHFSSVKLDGLGGAYGAVSVTALAVFSDVMKPVSIGIR
jgi:hypothetical protein